MSHRKQQTGHVVSPPVLSARKRFAFGLLASLLPLLLVGMIELALRFCGLGGYTPMFRKLGPVPGGNLVLAAQGGAASWFFANPDRAGTSEQYTFVDPKPTNNVRVLLLGESAMQGYPEPRHLSSSAFLQLMLQDAWSERQVEVINLGTTAIASFPVLGILTEALQYQPDLVVIYLGHNEFFGTYGVASVGSAGARQWILQATRWFHSLAIVQALQRFRHRGDSTENRTFMEQMMARTYIGPNDSLRKAAANLLYQNLGEMIRRCQAKGAKVLICLPPSNERDLAPIGLDKLEQFSPEVQREIDATPQYSSWYLEYVYYGLLCRQKIGGGLGTAEKQLAHNAIEQGHFLAEHMPSDTDFTQRYTGFLHFLCGEFAQAIPCLLAVQPQQTGIDRLALDQALVVCYLETQQAAKAHEVLTSGAEAAGAYAEQYKAMLAQLSKLQKIRKDETNSAPPR